MIEWSRASKRAFWVAPVVLVAAAALLQARGVNALLGSAISENADELSHARTSRGDGDLAPSNPWHSTNADAILAHNVFDSSAKPPDPPTPDSPIVEDDAPCDGVRVTAIVASPEADFSFASFSVQGATSSVMRRRGGDVAGREVAFIGRDRVWLKQGETICRVDMFRGAPPPAKPQPTGTTTPPPPPGVVESSLDPKLVARQSATDFDVDRSAVEALLTNQRELMGCARLAPDGLLVTSSKCKTLGMLGIEAGDRLVALNGYDVTNPEKMLEAYARLRDAPVIRIRLVRGGAPVEMTYRIR